MSTRTLDGRHVSWSYPGAPAPIFEELDLSLYAGERVALTGPNGSGKSTLLRILAGGLEPATGEVERPRRTTVVHQHDALATGGSVREAVLAELPSLGVLQRTIRAAEEAGLPDPLIYADAVAEYERSGGFALAARLEQAAARAGLPATALDRPAAALSGGQRRLLRLLGAFLAPADLVLLDEPTNHLDDDAATLLVDTIRASHAAVLAVSHDRWFMDQVAGRVLVLERGRLASYRGSYTRARAVREADRHERERDRERLEREIAKLREAERSYKVWGVRKEKEKSGAFDKGFIGARAARLMKRGILAKERLVERRERLEERRPWVDKRYRLALAATDLPTGTCLSVQGLTVARGGFTLADVHLSLAWGDRVAVIGPNGAGKTTLLAALVESSVRAGVHWSSAARIGYARQVEEGGEDEALSALFGEEEADEARRLLGAFGIPGAAWGDPLGSLSLGGRRKSAFVRLILDAPNVLILDEPTTHLDLPSIEMLEEALEPFAGTLLLVSHDRRLREAATTREWRVGEGTVWDAGVRDDAGGS